MRLRLSGDKWSRVRSKSPDFGFHVSHSKIAKGAILEWGTVILSWAGDCFRVGRGGSLRELSGRSSAVERQLPKLDVTGSIPVARSNVWLSHPGLD